MQTDKPALEGLLAHPLSLEGRSIANPFRPLAYERVGLARSAADPDPGPSAVMRDMEALDERLSFGLDS
jgi:hypothetical protein